MPYAASLSMSDYSTYDHAACASRQTPPCPYGGLPGLSPLSLPGRDYVCEATGSLRYPWPQVGSVACQRFAVCPVGISSPFGKEGRRQTDALSWDADPPQALVRRLWCSHQEVSLMEYTG